MNGCRQERQERVTYAWIYGVQARKDAKERAVPDNWAGHADAWLQGFDGASPGTEPKSVSDQLEAELDEGVVRPPRPEH